MVPVRRRKIKNERAWRKGNKRFRADRKLATRLYLPYIGEDRKRAEHTKKKHELFSLHGHYLTEETRAWRQGEVFLTTRGRLSKSDVGLFRLFKARVWFGFWKSLLPAFAPLLVSSFFFDASAEATWGAVWDATRSSHLAALTIFILYFCYHQSVFVSNRQNLRDNLAFPNKSEETHKWELRLYEKLRVEYEAYHTKQEELKRRRRQNAAKRRESEKRRRTSLQSLSHRARIPKHADDFEEVCAEWMRAAGYLGAVRTAKGPDGGADVVSNRAVAQAKMYSAKKVTAEEVRALVGTRQQYGKALALFFVYGLGYTEDAVQAARKTGVQLFALDVSTQKFKRITPPLDEGDADDEDLDDESQSDEF